MTANLPRVIKIHGALVVDGKPATLRNLYLANHVAVAGIDLDRDRTGFLKI